MERVQENFDYIELIDYLIDFLVIMSYFLSSVLIDGSLRPSLIA